MSLKVFVRSDRSTTVYTGTGSSTVSGHVVAGSGHVAGPSGLGAPQHGADSRNHSPDTDSAFCDNLSLLSSCSAAR